MNLEPRIIKGIGLAMNVYKSLIYKLHDFKIKSSWVRINNRCRQLAAYAVAEEKILSGVTA